MPTLALMGGFGVVASQDINICQKKFEPTVRSLSQPKTFWMIGDNFGKEKSIITINKKINVMDPTML